MESLLIKIIAPLCVLSLLTASPVWSSQTPEPKDAQSEINTPTTTPVQDDEITNFFIDTLAFKAGFSRSGFSLNDTNGGVDGVDDPDRIGFSYSLSAVFNNKAFPTIKPYVDYARIQYDDRNFTLFSLGARHDRFIDDNENWEWFIAAGIGRAFLHWEDNPAPFTASGLTGDEGLSGTLQTGLDWYLNKHWAIDFSVRYDMYDLDTSVVENGAVTTINDTSSLSALLGIVYRFGKQHIADTRDDDNDGVINEYDRCDNTLFHTPVNYQGCPQNSFYFSYVFKFDNYSIDEITEYDEFPLIEFLNNHPDYKVHIIGFTDASGKASYNKKLSLWRAKAAADFMLDKGIETKRISYEGKGSELGLESDDAAYAREESRRVVVTFYKSRNPHRPRSNEGQ